MSKKGVAVIWSAVEDLYRTGIHPAISFCLRRHGKVVLKRAIGHARRALGSSWKDIVRISDDPLFMKEIIPSANIVSTADEMSRFFQLLPKGG